MHKIPCLTYAVNIQCWCRQLFGSIVLQIFVQNGALLAMSLVARPTGCRDAILPVYRVSHYNNDNYSRVKHPQMYTANFQPRDIISERLVMPISWTKYGVSWYLAMGVFHSSRLEAMDDMKKMMTYMLHVFMGLYSWYWECDFVHLLWTLVSLLTHRCRVTYISVNWTVFGSDNCFSVFGENPVSEQILLYC